MGSCRRSCRSCDLPAAQRFVAAIAGRLAAPPTPRSALLALQAYTLATIGPKRHPSRPLRPLDEAIALAFWDACEQFDNDFPEGVPFEALPSEVYQLFVQRGRNASFWILETCLPWSAAVKIAEAIGEALGSSAPESWHAPGPLSRPHSTRIKRVSLPKAVVAASSP